MQVRDIMTENPACCAPETSLEDVARIMADQDCGEIPVLDERGRPLGVVTDRDITVRAVAQGRDPAATAARDVMTGSVITTTPDASLEDALAHMEESQVRRLPVVDEDGVVCGMVAQADIARTAPAHETAELVRDVSQPTLGRGTYAGA
ncbi:MAG TPA: CBS domain-containing protein [Woeseiaceae bacterium]|nr:CBS domain-containing protein [Woeseiaceae bacterium]